MSFPFPSLLPPVSRTRFWWSSLLKCLFPSLPSASLGIFSSFVARVSKLLLHLAPLRSSSRFVMTRCMRLTCFLWSRSINMLRLAFSLRSLPFSLGSLIWKVIIPYLLSVILVGKTRCYHRGSPVIIQSFSP